MKWIEEKAVVPLVMADVVALLRPSSVVALISSLSHCQTAKHNQRQAAMRDGGVGPTVGDRAKSRPSLVNRIHATKPCFFCPRIRWSGKKIIIGIQKGKKTRFC
jgi:hypothetical protein